MSGAGAARRFGHDGVNEGYQATMVGYVERGDGVVVLTNADGGRRLADEVVRAVAADYGWTELAPSPTVEVALPPATIARIAGPYEGGGLSLFVDARDDGLFVQTGGPRPERLVAIAPLRFRTDVSGILVEFSPDYASFRVVAGGPPITFTRSAPSPGATTAPLYLRGSMNGWSTATPLVRDAMGALAADVGLSPGEYQFKMGAEDWRSADYGTRAGDTATIGGMPLPLVPHGGNIRLVVIHEAPYRFVLNIAPNSRAELSIRQLPLK